MLGEGANPEHASRGQKFLRSSTTGVFPNLKGFCGKFALNSVRPGRFVRFRKTRLGPSRHHHHFPEVAPSPNKTLWTFGFTLLWTLRKYGIKYLEPGFLNLTPSTALHIHITRVFTIG